MRTDIPEDRPREGTRRPAGPRLTAGLLALVLIGLGGCASMGDIPDCTDPESAAPDYVIGSGDALQIFVWRNPELSSTVPVRPDGKISIPLVEDMQAVGKTPTELARDIEAELGEYLRSPEVNIIVATPGASNQVQVIGEVRAPASVPYRADLRVLDVLVAVGGLDEFAAGNRARIVRRNSAGETSECRVRLSDLVQDGDVSQNVRMLPGDVIVVPEARF
jgi:polysaccharide export outer membrane protein